MDSFGASAMDVACPLCHAGIDEECKPGTGIHVRGQPHSERTALSPEFRLYRLRATGVVTEAEVLESRARQLYDTQTVAASPVLWERLPDTERAPWLLLARVPPPPAPPRALWGIELRNGQWLASLDAEISVSQKEAWHFLSEADARRTIHDNPWIGVAGGMPKMVPTAEMEAALAPPETVDHPAHYGGKDDPYEAIKVIEAWELDFCTGNTVKYISRAGKKDPSKRIEDLKKGRWYLDRLIQRLEQEQGKR